MEDLYGCVLSPIGSHRKHINVTEHLEIQSDMGSGESTTRKVSFGVDEEDRVRILRGVKVNGS